MKAIQFILPLMMISKIMLGQEIKLEAAPLPVDAIAPEEEVLTFVEQMPEFPGGDDALSAYLSKNIKYPKQANEQGISGRVVINFVVNENGDIADVKVARGIGYGCDEEAMRVVRSMPNWRPGKQNGKAVRVSYSLPITFELEE